jgi:HAMP domain-containing protein
MVSDDELERHVNRVETGRFSRSPDVPTVGTTDGALAEQVDEMQAAARETHDELARRIRRVDEASAETARVEDIVERLDELEGRLAAIEERLGE